MPETTAQLKKRFRSAIKRGTGEAYLILAQNQNVNFSKEIIHATVNNSTSDLYWNDNRAVYLTELILLSAQQEEIIASIRSTLLNKKR